MTTNLLRKKLAYIHQQQQDFLILDSETTGLGNCEVIEFAIINLAGETLLNQRIKPNGIISDGASNIHGITHKDLVSSPTLPNLWGKIKDILDGKCLLIYNAEFDLKAIASSLKAWGIKSPFITRYTCMMHLYSQFVGEKGMYAGSYKWQKLPGGDHTALGDCQATLRILQRMSQVLDADNYVVKSIDISTPFEYQYVPPKQPIMSFDDFVGLYPF